MPNAIKYNTSAETLALKKGNFYIGTGDVGKGPTSSTGYYNGITPPSGGYTIYLNKESNGPSIYTVTTEAQMVSLTNTIGSQNFTTSGQCLNWFATQSDKMIFNRDYEGIVTNGLVLNVDAGFTPSYPKSGTTWYDLSSGGNNGTLTNGPTFNSSNGGSIVFDGVDDYADCGLITSLPSGTQNRTMMGWVQDNSISDYDVLASIFGYGNNESGEGRFFMFCVGGTSFVNRQLAIWTNSRNHTSSFTLNRNTWTHIATTVTPGTTYPKITIYKNGVPDNGSEQNINTLNTNNFQIADYTPAGSYDSNFNGKIALVQVYNRALTATEVLQNYNAQKGRFGL
jgi:hypothetical protein